MECRPVPGTGLGVAPVPERPEQRPAAAGEGGVAGQTPEVLLVALTGLAGSLHHAVSGLAVPIEASEFLEPCAEDAGELGQEADVVERVFDHLVGEGALGPVRLARGLGKGDAEVFLHQAGQTELGLAAESCRDHCVEDVLVGEFPRAAEQAQVVVRVVEEDRLPLEGGEEFLKRQPRQGIDQAQIGGKSGLGLLAPSALDEAELLKVAVQAVGLGVESDLCLRRETVEIVPESGVPGDQGSAMKVAVVGRSPAWRARGSRTSVLPSVGMVTKGPPASGATSVKATSGTSVGMPSRGNSLRSGW